MDGARNEEGFMQQQQDLQQRARPPEAGHDAHQPSLSLPPQRCPRCDSSNTKFCYYNNYSLSQPRYFCKACRRYWTHGGTLRNVPIGGGCRKSKRPRTSSPSSNGMISRPQGLQLPTTAARSQNPAALMSGQPSRPPPPPLGGGAFYAGGSFLSSLAAMQSGGVNQGAPVMGGGGGGRFGANMALLQGMSFQSLKSPAPAAVAPTHFFPPQQNLIPPGTFSSWTQSVVNAGASSSSAGSAAGMWSSSGGGDRAGSSFGANQWSDCNPGFNPSE